MPSTPEDRLRKRIRRDGPIRFSEFMEEALYGEGGYYAGPASPIGKGGDFITGSSYSDLFGRTTAGLLRRLDSVLGRRSDYLEVGYGSGRHLGVVAGAAPGRRLIGVERGGGAPPPASSAASNNAPADPGVRYLERLAEVEPPVVGLVFSYELFDALAVDRLLWRDGEVREVLVDWQDGAFAWREGGPAPPELASRIGSELVEGQIADVADWGALYRELARKLERGLLVTCDYGFERESLFDPRVRRHGTLASYYGHRVHRNVLADAGRQDLTAHVDFSALIEAGEAEGLETVAWTRQAAWLAANGLFGSSRRVRARRPMRVMETVATRPGWTPWSSCGWTAWARRSGCSCSLAVCLRPAAGSSSKRA